MKIVATMPVRNGAWCVTQSIRVALSGCDEIAIFDHCSVDGTSAMLRAMRDEFADHLHVLTETDPVRN